MNRENDPRYKPCSTCGEYVKPASGYLGGGVKCNECVQATIEATR